MSETTLHAPLHFRDRDARPELSTGHFSWTQPDPTRPGETLTRPDPGLLTDKKSDPTWPDQTLPYTYTMFHEFNMQVANREQYTIVAWFRGKQWEIFLFRFCNVISRGGKRSRVVLVYKTVVSRQQKDCKYQMLVKCIRGLIWAGLNSEVWTVIFLQGSGSRPASQADQPECRTRPNVYEFNIALTLHQPAIVISIRDYITRTDEKSLSDWGHWAN